MKTKNKKTKRNYNKYLEGGELQGQNTGQMVGQSLGTALALAGIPGLGPILGQLGSLAGQKSDQIKAIDNSLNQLNTSVNPYGFENGGKLKKKKGYSGSSSKSKSSDKLYEKEFGGELGGMDDLLTYDGNTHANGGIVVQDQGIPDPSGSNEVEGEETVYRVGNNSYIFSQALKL